MHASYRFVVSGRVQGVFFRQSTREHAEALGLDGWVLNRSDGRVEGVACGPADALEQLRNFLHRGPPNARVDGVDWQPADETPAPGFRIRR
jgi:acylphosphatase